MARYIKFRAKSSAEKRSRALWAQKLGRPVDGNAVTVHLYGWKRSTKSFGGSVLLVPDDGALLTQDEKEDLREVGDEEWVEWIAKYRAADLDPDD
jgi:hypothetical protein